MIKILRFMKPYKWTALLVVALTFVQAISQLYLPNLMADIVDEGVVGQDIQFIIRTGGIMLGFTIIVSICTIFARLFAAKVGVGFAMDLRGAVFTKVENFSSHEMDKIGISSLITRSTNDVTQIQNVMVMMLTMLLSAPITAVGGLIMAWRTDSGLLWVVGVAIAVILGFIAIVATKVLPLFKSLQKKIDGVNLVLREFLTGIRVIRAFNKTEYETERFRGANEDLTGTSIKVFRIMSVMMPTIMLIMNVTTIAIIWFGAKRVDSGAMQVGDMMAFQQYVMQIMFSLIMGVMMFVMLPRASASAERINEVLDVDYTIKDPTEVQAITGQKGYVEFIDVSFYYSGAEEPAIKGINFSAKPGEVTAIIGGTGSGKTSLINLVARFYDAKDGQVLVNGVNVREQTQETLRSFIGLVPQKINLFKGTIAENVRFGKSDATDDEVHEALDIAQASEFVNDLPEGIESEVSQGGTNYSGGQKQRLSIARAIVKKPDVYIFDDSFSALDFKTDAKLRGALSRHIADSTVLLVAQRVSAVMSADRIIVLDKGLVAGQGTHSELIKTCDVYKEIVYSQLSEEELS